MAAEEGAVLVDGYAAIDADRANLIGSNGLHLTIAGYEKLAAAFFEAIKAKFELPPTASLTGGRGSCRQARM
jgi:hypothetical protein